MFKIYIKPNSVTGSGYYCGKYTCNGEEFLILKDDINDRKVKVYKTENGLSKGVKYLTENWVYKKDMTIKKIEKSYRRKYTGDGLFACPDDGCREYLDNDWIYCPYCGTKSHIEDHMKKYIKE